MTERKDVLYRYVKKILHVRIGHLGEVILSTPLLKTIKNNWPDRILHSMVLPGHKVIAKSCACIDKIITFNNKWGLVDRFNFLKALENQNYDLVIAHTPTITGYLAAYFTRAPHRVGVLFPDSALEFNVGKFVLTNPLIFDTSPESEKKIPHEVEMALNIADELGIKRKYRDIVVNVGSESERFAEATFRKWNWSSSARTFCVHLSDRWLRLGWDNQHFQKLVTDLQNSFNNSYILFTYRSWQVDIGREMNTCYDKDPSVNCIWDMNILQWAALMKKCDYVITEDPAAIHVASSQKVPVIAIYPPENYEINSQRWAPWRVKNKKIVHKAPRAMLNEIVSAIKSLDEVY